MQSRLNFTKASPVACNTMLDIERYLAQCGLERSLLHLVKMRASQINGCAYCLDMHSKDARAHGETEQRLYALSAWCDSPFYSARERAALAWTDALTLVAETHAPDIVYHEVRAQFSEAALVDLTLAIATINSWNRLMIAFRSEPGTYRHVTAAQGVPSSES